MSAVPGFADHGSSGVFISYKPDQGFGAKRFVQHNYL